MLVRVHPPATHTNGYLGCQFPAQAQGPPVRDPRVPPLKPEICQAVGPHEPWRELGRVRLLSGRSGTATKGATVRYPKNPTRVRHQKEETRTSKMQNADLHQRIKLRAYLLWEQEGRPEGRAEEHWLRAEAEVAGVNTGGEASHRDSRHRRGHLPGVRGNRAPWSEPM